MELILLLLLLLLLLLPLLLVLEGTRVPIFRVLFARSTSSIWKSNGGLSGVSSPGLNDLVTFHR